MCHFVSINCHPGSTVLQKEFFTFKARRIKIDVMKTFRQREKLDYVSSGFATNWDQGICFEKELLFVSIVFKQRSLF